MAMRATTAMQRFQGMARASENVCYRWVGRFWGGKTCVFTENSTIWFQLSRNNNILISVN